ncbi:hypothetical protein B0H19DRAFT_1251371 [Mycena capillaripes]|nr:hypothetical protein B0H19DRAFT_1251371 [Mycena capillaripes]
MYSQPSPAPAPAQKRPGHRRCRTLSSVSIPPAGSAPKIILAMQNSTSTSAARGAAAGAFTLTRCARAALRGLVLGTYDDEADLYMDSSSESNVQYTAAPTHVRTRSNYSDKDVPSISRTASPFEGERAPIPPGWGGRGGRAQRRERSPHREQSQRARIHPVLETVERKSRVGTGRVVCAACAKPGVNFPRCPRCAKMWCCRACRTSTAHRCVPRRTQTT